jgi:ABC-type branched-subunit amino acid transport system substrate-binding protein
MKTRARVMAATAAALVLAAGCGSSKSSGSGGGHTITIGVLTDNTGLGAPSNDTTVKGVEAGLKLAARAGYNIKFVVADTTTTPQGVVTAAHTLVQQDHVLATVSVSSLTFLTSSYLTQQNMPVVGMAEDGPEWAPSKNMFSVVGPIDTTKVSTTAGQLYKMLGGTSIGAIGYGISPTSSESAKGTALSAQAAGLKIGFLDTQFPFGSTNVGPDVIKMKDAGIDSFTSETESSTSYAFITALRQAGVNLKVVLLPTGYGGDLIAAGPGAQQTAQGAYFSTSFLPVESNTPATQQFQADLRSVGVTSDPTYAEYCGYTSIALLVQGLQKAGPNPTQASLMSALSSITAFDGAGLFGGRTSNPNDRSGTAAGTAANCLWATKLVGSSFQLVPNADPICGTVIPGMSAKI